MAVKIIHVPQDVDVARIYENLLTVAFRGFLEKVGTIKNNDQNIQQMLNDECDGLIEFAYKFANNATDHWYTQIVKLLEEQDEKQE